MYAQIAAALILVFASAAVSAAAPAAESVLGGTAVAATDSIPPNCTLNPWTHKYVCHKWPKPKKYSA